MVRSMLLHLCVPYADTCLAGVPPELDPRASNFRLPAPSTASIYSVSVQAPASPPSTVDDDHPADGGADADDEDGALATPLDIDGLPLSSEAESLRGLSPPPTSLNSRGALTSSTLAMTDRLDPFPRSTSAVGGLLAVPCPSSSFHPPTTGPPSPLARPTFGPGFGFSSSLYPLRSARFAQAPASIAATIGSEPDAGSVVTTSASSDSHSLPSSPEGRSLSSFDVASPQTRLQSGRYYSLRRDGVEALPAQLDLDRPRSASLQSESTASSSYGVGSAPSGTESPYGDRATSFAGTSIGATSVGSAGGIPPAALVGGGAGEPILEEAEHRTNASVSVAPSEAGSGADASELNAPPASYASSLGYLRRSSQRQTAGSIDEENDDGSLLQGGTDGEDDLAAGDGDSTHHRATSIEAGSYGATPPGTIQNLPRLRLAPGELSMPLSLSFGPGLAAFRSAQPTRAPSTVATAGTASPPRSEVSTTSEASPKAREFHSLSHPERIEDQTALAALSDGEYVARSDSEQATAGSEDSEDDGTDTEPPFSQTPLRNSSYQTPHTPPVRVSPQPPPLLYSHTTFRAAPDAEDEGSIGPMPGSWIGTPPLSARASHNPDPHSDYRYGEWEYGDGADQHAAPPPPPMLWDQPSVPLPHFMTAMRGLSLAESPQDPGRSSNPPTPLAHEGVSSWTEWT